MPHQDRLNIAVFIDFDNIEIGVKTTLGQQFDVGTILDAIKERGEVVTKIAYADWTRAGEYSRTLTQHAIRLVQRNLTPGGDKNGADINLALDALEMAFTHQHINAFVIVGGDSDFLSLVEKLKTYDKKVFVVGGRAFTSVILQRNCHEFIAYENLAGVRKAAARSGRPAPSAASSPIAQAFPIVRRALKILADREVSPQTGLLKSTLLQLDSTFSERNYGASSFLDFTEKLAQAGLVQLKHSGRSVMVELNPAFADDGDAPEARTRQTPEDQPGAAAAASGAQSAPRDARFSEPRRAEAEGTMKPADGRPEIQGPIESPTEGVQLVGQILRGATAARWPMYLRNVKQILRAYRGEGPAGANTAGGFDERRYGFGSLMDLLRACQREGIVRLERDRRGGLRVLQGPAIQRGGAPQPQVDSSVPASVQIYDVENDLPAAEPTETIKTQRGELDETQPAIDAEQPEVEPIPRDMTAELLGRAKARRPRAKVPVARRSAPRKDAVPKRSAARSRKSVPETE